MLVRFLGHSCVSLNTGGTSLIIDPYLNGNPQAVIKAGDVKTDWVLVSHGHHDHIGDAIEIARNNNAAIISVAEIARYCKAREVKSHAMHIGGKHEFGDITVKLTMALHGSSTSTNPIEYLGQACGFLIFSEGKTIYFSGDTGLFGDMALLGRLHPVDLAILPIGDNYTMGPEDALEAVRMINPKQVLPVHYNTWDIIAQDPALFRESVRRETGVPVTVLRPGETLEL